MIRRVTAIAFIYLGISLAWVVLGTAVAQRTSAQDGKLKGAVGQLWGTIQRQQAPLVYYRPQPPQRAKVEPAQDSRALEAEGAVTPLLVDASDIDVDLDLEHRRKGLLWYATYRVRFAGKYRVVNSTAEPREVFFDFAFPSHQGVYDNFRLAVGGKEMPDVQVKSGKLSAGLRLGPGQAEQVEVSYASQGLDEWWYDFGEDVRQVKNFSLAMHTNFEAIDFPPNGISPTRKERAGHGWELAWQYASLLSGVKVGMILPHKLNPGPWVSKVSLAAPVSLLLFFFLLLTLTTARGVKLHPMNYLFIGAAFFSFHLLLAYLVDHLSVHLSFLLSSLASVFLVLSYLRLAVTNRFTLLGAGGLQLVYLVLFSYTFFFEEYTGLGVTVLCLVTLFLVMQFTGRVDWDTLFRKGEQSAV